MKIEKLIEAIKNGYCITKEEAKWLYYETEENVLFDGANTIRKHFMGDRVDLCTIMNAKSGSCSENCKFCAQSSHYDTGIQTYPLVDEDEALQLARENFEAGVGHFSLVTSGATLLGEEFNKVLTILTRIKQELPELHLCVSLGMIDYEQAVALKKVGVEKYHHNIESSKNYFPNICTTHTYEERITTIIDVKKAGLAVCSGGIIGMGENVEDYLDMAFELKDLGVKSIPLNLLMPIKGTPLEEALSVEPLNFLRIAAMFRFILPDAFVRYGGGRSALGEYAKKGFLSGFNAVLTGNYLTTSGSTISQDIEMIKDLGLEV